MSHAEIPGAPPAPSTDAAPRPGAEGAAGVVALLDDRDASAAHPTSRLYRAFVREHRSVDPATLEAAWAAVEADQRDGLHAVVLADYEWGAKLLGAGTASLPPGDRSALRVLMFRRLDRLARAEVDAWLAGPEAAGCFGSPAGVGDAGEGSLAAPDAAGATGPGVAGPGVAGVAGLAESLDRPAFLDAIGRIHEAIRDGETYQVNFTYRLHGEAYGSPLDLYRRLRARQPVAYGALIRLPVPAGEDDGQVEAVLSCSPELFVRHAGGIATARPMKGTASRITGPEGDSEQARHLSLDIKNRAENLMIVDLLRNDLGRVSEIGSVQVPELFTVEPYSTVFQMTSTVRSRLRGDLDMPGLLRAIFPCGSITGAPKHQTMKLIAGLESTPRGLYTGAIGWVDAPADGRRLGDFCFSVAIRTLTLGAARGGRRRAVLGIGAGIVLDSVAADEYAECRLKARFLTGLDPGFRLFETMRAGREDGVRHLERHLDRLASSAATLGFAFERAAIVRALEAQRRDWPAAQAMRLRLALGFDGTIEIAAVPLPPLPPGPAAEATVGDALPVDASWPACDGLVRVSVSPLALPDADPLAAHKTTRRAHYDAAIRAAEAEGAFDRLFFTRDGRLAEGARSNVFLRLDGRWCTPPVADGALPGVMRGLLLDDPRWAATERSLRREDLARAEAIVVCNALRGVLAARLVPAAAAGPAGGATTEVTVR